MYEHLHIAGFRGIRELTVSDLRRINLFVGPNNVGKTSLLEAAWLRRAPGNPTLILNVAQFRGVAISSQLGTSNATPTLLWRNLFYRMQEEQGISIEARENGEQEMLSIRAFLGSTRQLRGASGVPLGANGKEAPVPPATSDFLIPEILEYTYSRGDRDPIRTTFEYGEGRTAFNINPLITRPLSLYLSSRRWPPEQELAENFTKLEESGAVEILIGALRQFDDRLERLSLGFIDGRPVIRGHMAAGPLIPLYFLGDGAVHLTNFVVSIAVAKSGLVAIDEVENGIYYENLAPMWRSIDLASRRGDAQIFATTHSRECLQAAIDALGGESDDAVRIFRLERKDDYTRAVAYDMSTARQAFAMDLEVR